MTSLLIAKKINIPNKIVEDIRDLLFKIKTNYGMIPYSFTKNFLLNNPNIYDIYTNELKTIDKIRLYNIEHVVLASIITNRTARDFESEIFINNEPFHDPHILFPTLKIVNSFRSNYIYGDIKERGFHFSKAIDESTINIIKDEKIISENDIDINITTPLEAYNKNKNIYIDDVCKYSEFLDKTGHAYYKCDIGECMFEPKDESSGAIARIVFYYFFMYAFNPTIRPYTNDDPWLALNIKKVRERNICFGLNYDEWKKFFFDNFYYYYYCAKNYPATQLEHNRNIEIINFTGVPNIFIGYYNKEGEYIINTFKIIDELFGFEIADSVSELNQVLVNCKTDDIETNKTYGSSFDYSKNKYLIENIKTNTLICGNRDFYTNIITSQQKLFDNIQIYFTDSIYENSYNYITELLITIDPIFQNYNQNNFNKIIKNYSDDLQNNKNQLVELCEKISKKIKSILEDIQICKNLCKLYNNIINQIYKLICFLRVLTKKEENIKKTSQSPKNKKKAISALKILTQDIGILERIIKKYKTPNNFNKTFLGILSIDTRTDTIINIPISHTCSPHELHERPSISTREFKKKDFYSKYQKYKNKYLLLKYIKK
jgi:endonuclease I